MLDIVKVMLDFYSCIINTGNITMIKEGVQNTAPVVCDRPRMA